MSERFARRVRCVRSFRAGFGIILSPHARRLSMPKLRSFERLEPFRAQSSSRRDRLEGVPLDSTLSTSPGLRWTIVALLSSSIAINLIDRQVLSVLAPVLREELRLSATQYAYITASFQLGMMAGQVPIGALMDQIGTRWGWPPSSSPGRSSAALMRWRQVSAASSCCGS